MELVENVVIVGAGIAGLTTSLGLHRLGIKSLVLESADCLRITGFALLIWTNAWKALDAIGVGDSLRQQHDTLLGNVTSSTESGLQTAEMSFKAKGKVGKHEVRCVKRKLLLEALSNELPSGTIRFSSKLVAIEESGFFKLLHLADGTVIRTKVLIGTDGVNSVVAKWLGFNKATHTGRCGIRGCATFDNNHGFEPLFNQFFGDGVRFGTIPCDPRFVYWFFTFAPSPDQEKELEENPTKAREFVLSKLGVIPDQIRGVFESTELEAFKLISPLRCRKPWELLWKSISKGNVCVAGDAIHPMTPDLGQGGCSALEDGVVLARCLGEVLLRNSSKKSENLEEEYKNIEMGLKKYASERQWRSFDLVATAYAVGYIQQSDGRVLSFLRDKFLAPFLTSLVLNKADFDCGKLTHNS
ncbi:monooxygenase 2-like [Humulus lupulus]|uniref:monooxygenase 2-like n=1 Tax=Humulus lupulus TaxID=3486 RepID=UPI002B403EE1|nr:monooxygenase 2-like [Humulus lupulus]